MWVVDTLLVCFVLNGCLLPMGRDEAAPHLWTTGPTKAACEQSLIDYSHTVAARYGDEVLYVKAVCERLGA